LEPLGATRCLNALGETTDKQPKTVAVSFGPEHAPLEQRPVEAAWEEARTLTPRPEILLFAAFHFDPEAAKDIDELTLEKTGNGVAPVSNRSLPPRGRENCGRSGDRRESTSRNCAGRNRSRPAGPASRSRK